MATAVQPAMIMAPSYNQHSQCIDPEQEFFDFSQLPSPTPANLKREASTSTAITSPTSTNIDDDLQTPAKPSHEYERFKQQTGLPSGSIAGLNPVYNSGFGFSSSGIDEMAMMGDSMMDAGMWNTGMPMDSNVNMGGMDFQQPNYLNFNDNSQDDFVDPSSIEEPPQVRVWPGMHQQAALAKAQAQAQAQQQRQAQQQQMALQRQQQQQQQQQQQARAQPAPRKTSTNSTTFSNNQPPQPTFNMSAPNANKPNEGIVGQIGNSISNAANYVSETIQGGSAEASKEANKQQAKGNVPGQDSIGDRVSGALGAAGDKIDQSKHEGSAEANKRSI